MTNYDVVVVGAGPVGSTFARHIAEKGFKIGIMEKKKEIGVPLQCAGLLGKQIKDVNILPDELIINPVYGAYLHSPGDHILKVAKNQPEAYVVDRVGYDKFLAKLAVDAGAELFLNHKVKDFDLKKGCLHLNNGKEDISGKIIVGADGYNSVVARKFPDETSKHPDSVQAAQFMVDFGRDIFDTDYVHLHVSADISPGFIWIIPLNASTARVGLFGNSDYHTFNNILKDFLNGNPEFNGYSIVKKYHGRIPVYNSKKKIVKDRAILLGDAASQVKPTTGGGLIIGFKSAQLAADVVTRALDNDDLRILTDYQSIYRKEYKNELSTQFKVRKIFKSLTDDDLDQMFIKLKEEGAEDIISKYGDMDDQSPLVKEMFKRGLLFKILPKILSRTISTLWK